MSLLLGDCVAIGDNAKYELNRFRMEIIMVIADLINALPGAVAQGLIWGIMAIGVYITYKVLDLADLTVDGTMCTGGAVCAVMMIAGHNVWVSMICAVAAGALAGFITGIFHLSMGIPAILAGILSQLGLYSINLKIIGKANEALPAFKYDVLVAIKYNKGVPITENTIFIVGIFTLVIIALLYWFFGTSLGCSIRATGSNKKMSRAQGINTKFNTMLGLMISNALVALSSALYTQYQGFTDVNMGRGAIVIGLAAVIIGSVIFEKIFKNFALKLLSVSLGAVIYYIVLQIVIWMGFDPDLLKLLSAVVVAIFLAVPYMKREYLPALLSIKKRFAAKKHNRNMLSKKKSNVALSQEGGAK